MLGAAISAAADRLFQKKRAEGEGKKEEAEGKTGNYNFLSVKEERLPLSTYVRMFFWGAMNACTLLVLRVSPDPIRLGDCGKS